MNCAEVLFQPIFIGKGGSGCHGILVFQMKFDDDIRKNLYANVVTSKKQNNTVFFDAKEIANEPQSGKC